MIVATSLKPSFISNTSDNSTRHTEPIHYLSNSGYTVIEGSFRDTSSSASPQYHNFGRSVPELSYSNNDMETFFNKIDSFIKFAPLHVKDQLISEMVDALELSYIYHDNLAFTRFIENWVDTIDVCSNPVLLSKIQDAKKEISRGEGIEWVPGMYTE